MMREQRQTDLRHVGRVVFQWPRFGPFHMDRLSSAYEALKEQGIDLIALETSSDSAEYAWREITAETPYRRLTLFPGRVYEDLSPTAIHKAVFRALDEISPAAVFINSYSTPDARAALLWCIENEARAICITDSRREDAPRKPWKERLKASIVSQFDGALVSGTASSRYVQSLGISSGAICTGCDVIDNAYFERQSEVALSDRDAEPSTLPGLSDERPFFLASARFMPRKDVPTLIRGYAAYRNSSLEHEIQPWRLVVLGDGAGRAEVEALIDAFDISDSVVLAGWKQHDELPAYYGNASAFVHTALVDQWGIVVNEAMASGLPVIVSDGTGSAQDLVEDGKNGYVFPAGDPAFLAKCMHSIAHVDNLASFSDHSRATISAWPLSKFGDSVVELLRITSGSEHRPGALRAKAIILITNIMSRSPRSFHAIEG